MKVFIKKNWYKLILILVAVMCATASLFVGKFYPVEQIEGKYVYQNENSVVYLEVIEDDDKTKIFYEMTDKDGTSYNNETFDIDEEKLEYGNPITKTISRDDYEYECSLTFTFYPHGVNLAEKVKYGQISSEYDDEYFLEKLKYVDTSTEQNAITVGLRLVATVLLSIGVVLMVAKRKTVLLVAYLGVYTISALSVFFIGSNSTCFKNTYTIELYNKTVKLYEYEIKPEKKIDGTYSAVVEEKYNWYNMLFQSRLSFGKRIFSVPIEKKGNRLIIDGKYSEEFGIKVDFDKIEIKFGYGKSKAYMYKDDEINKLKINKIDNFPLFITSLAVVSATFAGMLVLYIVLALKENKRRKTAPLIEDGEFLCGEILYSNPEYEDFLTCAGAMYVGKRISIKGNSIVLFDKEYQDVSLKKIDKNICEKFLNKKIRVFEVIEIVHEDGKVYFIKYKEGNGIVTTMMDKVLMMIGLEVQNEA